MLIRVREVIEWSGCLLCSKVGRVRPGSIVIGIAVCLSDRQYTAHVRLHFVTNLGVAGGLILLQNFGAGRCVHLCCWAS